MPFLKKHKIPKWSTIQEERTLKHGLRHAVFNSVGDTIYVGEWQRNKKSGKGTQIVKDKWVYEGEWLNGLRHGYGVFSFQLDNKIRIQRYEGEWAYGKPQGFGTRQYNDGSMYEGNWLEGQRSGKGRMWNADNSFYEGDWLEDKQHGEGLCVYANGNRYEGNWFKGFKHGKGCYYHLDSGQKQVGVWVEDIVVVSQMSDIHFRQSGIEPTPYPIIENELKNINEVIKPREQSAIHTGEIIAMFMDRVLIDKNSTIKLQSNNMDKVGGDVDFKTSPVINN